MNLPEDTEEMCVNHGCACGHFALAVAMRRNVSEVARFFPQLAEGKRWVSTRTMEEALRLAEQPAGLTWEKWPTWGMVLIQGLGSWMRPEVPYVARLQRTHWVATLSNPGGRLIADVNDPEGWMSFAVWQENILQPMLQQWKATGWDVKRGYEVEYD